jgi:hypothetical protein
MSSSSKRQQTMAKRAREQAVREKRERKAEKKAARREQALNPDAATSMDADGDVEADDSGEQSQPTSEGETNEPDPQ